MHDSRVFEQLLDQTTDQDNTKRAISATAPCVALPPASLPSYADSAYRSREKEEKLAAENMPSQICEKGARNHPLTEAQKASNKEKSKVRARVEHVFGAHAHRGGHLMRTIGLLRANVKIGMMNRVYNRVRLGQLLKRDGKDAFAAA